MDQLSHPAQYWESIKSPHPGTIRCNLCPHHCLIEVGKRGLCRSRYNQEGKLFTINYGRTISLSVDPVEKKPLYHYYPGTQILSIGPNSCNLNCFFCQNHSVSQADCSTRELNFQQLREVFEHNPSLPKRLALTYTEPLTWFEYIIDLADSLPDIKLVLITNGYIEKEPLEALLPKIDAMNVDLKSIRDEFYVTSCQGRLEPVLNTIGSAVAHGVHLEITNLIIPGLNDSDQEYDELARTIATIDCEIPLHFSAYHPSYKSSIPATSPRNVLHARAVAQKYLSWVYAGNIYPGTHSDTCCPACGTLLISRQTIAVHVNINNAGFAACPVCAKALRGRFGT